MRSFGTACRALALRCLSTGTRSDRHFPDFPGACARGGGGVERMGGHCHLVTVCSGGDGGIVMHCWGTMQRGMQG